MESLLRTRIQNVLKELGLPEVDFSLEHPKELSHGDWATNVALVVGKQTGSTPLDVAKSIVTTLGSIENVEKIEVAGAGFINFTLDREVFIKGLAPSVNEEWGSTDIYKGKKILVEHSSPNLFKPFHIGHLMNNTIGESLTRLAKTSGASVTAISFPSDISLGIAKAIYVLMKEFGADFVPTDVSVLGEAYVKGTKIYEEDEGAQKEIREIANKLYSGGDSSEWRLFQTCKDFNIKYFEQTVARLGSHFDSYIYEGESGIRGKEIVLEHTPSVFTKSEGAIVYIPEEERKLHTAVFINSDGNPTYEAKDIGLLDLKFSRYSPDISIIITDNQQTSHFEVVVDAAGKIKPEWKFNSVHRSHGRMSFKGQKMSSRLGGVPLVEEVLGAIAGEVKEKNPDITDTAAEHIGIGAIKFAILRAKAGSNIDFDPETSLSFEGGSGPYLQYSAVRALSLIQKGNEVGVMPSFINPQKGTETLERYIARFPEVVLRAQKEWAPHYLVTYLLELSQYFNSWYGQEKIIDENKDASSYRLGVVSAVRNTLVNGLFMLGIEVPEKM